MVTPCIPPNDRCDRAAQLVLVLSFHRPFDACSRRLDLRWFCARGQRRTKGSWVWWRTWGERNGVSSGFSRGNERGDWHPRWDKPVQLETGGDRLRHLLLDTHLDRSSHHNDVMRSLFHKRIVKTEILSSAVLFLAPVCPATLWYPLCPVSGFSFMLAFGTVVYSWANHHIGRQAFARCGRRLCAVDRRWSAWLFGAALVPIVLRYLVLVSGTFIEFAVRFSDLSTNSASLIVGMGRVSLRSPEY